MVFSTLGRNFGFYVGRRLSFDPRMESDPRTLEITGVRTESAEETIIDRDDNGLLTD